MIRRIVLTGLSGTGKSTVGRLVADSLGWDLLDTDAEIERLEGRSIPDIFSNDGENAFRRIEGGVFRRGLARNEVVIATGGGAVLDQSVWSDELLGAESALVVWLDGDAATLVHRLMEQARVQGTAADRPLLQGDAIGRLTSMRAERDGMYARADVALDVVGRLPDNVAADICELAHLGMDELSDVRLTVENAASAIRVGAGSSRFVGERIQSRWPRAQRVWVVVDANVQPHIEPLIGALRDSSVARIETFTVAPGESSKSLASLSELYDWTLTGGIERGDVVVAVGGGMVGDLAGFAAATVLRGVGLVQVPTTLLSMVDSSVGGKTGINHATGKNLIGAFYQPSEVIIDPGLLATLPSRELRSGWAEIIKHAVIEASTPAGQEPVIMQALERNGAALRAHLPLLTAWLIRRNVSLKASVVEADERESGLRAILNFGHTIGHGIEAAGFSLLHGEAVAVGISAALYIAEELEMVRPVEADRIRALLVEYELPVTADVDAVLVRSKMSQDKKKSGGKQTWVLPVSAGGVQLVTGVPDDVVIRAISRVTSSA